MSVTVFDDRNALIVYSTSPGWTQGGNVSDFQGTSTWTTSAGASFTFKFTGVSISVYGTLSGTTAPQQSAYSIDGGDAQAFTAVTPTGVVFTFHQLFFSRSGLTAGVSHTLVVTNLVENTWYFLDSIQVEAASTTTTTSSPLLPITTTSSTVSTSSTTTAATTPTTTSSSALRTSTTSSQQSSGTSLAKTSSTGAQSIATSATGGTVVTVTTGGASVILVPTVSPDSVNLKSSAPTGPIIGGVLGGIIVLLLIIAAFVFLRWRRKRAVQPALLAVHPMMTAATDDAPSRIDAEPAPASPPSADFQPHSKFRPYDTSPSNFSSPSGASASEYREGSVTTTPSSPHGYDRLDANHFPPPKYERYEED
ncbi:hypothetical protein HYPSUDRAFT_48706 [Hypholoma sublateritium FD-334 SS-4]|uniref:Mid2 domain-containing protein n=1 Tax=Hypholoma sublateritium (strain FD-334 SS-4) TaxID=945553 RepID=A0A0D2KK08_HYPSF|nr:hypothetical protein HYPSUDRAFT_48706 [Hypholoma sublateritium FD-334 SS-4]